MSTLTASTTDQLLEALPAYAKDLKLNFSTLARNQTELTKEQLWGTLVASAVAARNRDWINALVAEAANYVTPQVIEAAKGAAAIMAMNNIYYRFLHLSSNQRYATIPARLRMNILRSHGADEKDFELWATAVSAINGCGKCVDSHEQVLRQKGVTEETIIAVVRVAAVVHALATIADAE
jgi:alkyl hydroperoxide reductase subunit D